MRENNACCFLLRMAHLHIFIHNSEISKDTIQPRLKNGTHFSCYESLPKGCNVHMSKCLTLTLDAMSRNGQRQAWWPECVQPPSSPGKLAARLKSPFGDSCSSCATPRVILVDCGVRFLGCSSSLTLTKCAALH